jgi:uncharacterized protein (TIGR03067 family)
MKWRILLSLAVGLWAVADVSGVPDWQAKKKKPPDDRELIQGTWTAAFWEMDGTKMPGTLKLDLRGNKWCLIMDNKEMIKGTIKLDPTRKVKTFDATVTEGTGKGLTVPGVYRLEEYTLTLCGNLGEPRPREFVTKGNSRGFLFILKRAKR